MKIEIDFYDLKPEQFPTLDLTEYSDAMLAEMAYFLWSMYPDDVGLMAWRTERLLPLVRISDLNYEDDIDDDSDIEIS